MPINAAAITTRGVVKAVNEDRVLLNQFVLSDGRASCIGELPFMTAIFDGVSAGGRGADASTLASCALLEAWNRSVPLCRDVNQGMKALGPIFQDVQEEVLTYQDFSEPRNLAATTVSGMCVCEDGSIAGFNAGDSRVYRLRDGMLIQLTDDDSVVESLRQSGAGEEVIEQAALADAHVITKALGIATKGEAPVLVEDYGVACEGDLFLGCSDGLSGFVARKDIKGVLQSALPLETKAAVLLDLALRSGSTDNISIFLVAA